MLIRTLLATVAAFVVSQSVVNAVDLTPGPCRRPPPVSAQHSPTAPYKIIKFDAAMLQAFCQGGRIHLSGCAIEPPSANSPDHWIIAINSDLSVKDFACAVTYEKAHLPPNNWQDDALEKALQADYLDTTN